MVLPSNLFDPAIKSLLNQEPYKSKGGDAFEDVLAGFMFHGKIPDKPYGDAGLLASKFLAKALKVGMSPGVIGL